MGIQQASELVESFLEDHHRMMRLLASVHRALEQGEAETARELADELDMVGGPHIDFEEQVLYPLIAVAVDRGLARRLYDEHAVVREAIERLLDAEETRPDEEALAALCSSFQVGLDHASHCGTLASHLDALPFAQRLRALEKLRELRRLGRRWTALPPPPELKGDDG